MTTFQWIAGSGDWETAADWNQDAVPGYGDDVILGGSGAYDVTIEAGSIFTGSNVSVDSVTIDDPAATLSVAGVLGLYAGQQQTLVLQEGTLFLAGTIDGGTLSFGSGTLDFAPSPSVIGYNGPDDSPALNDVTLLGALDLSAADTDVVLAYGTKVETASGKAGTIDVSGAGDELILSNTTLDDVTLTLTLGKDANGRDTLLLAIGTVTLGSGVTTTLDATNAGGTIDGNTLINEGLLSVIGAPSQPEFASNYIVTNLGSFVNAGTLALTDHAYLISGYGSFANTGVLSIDSTSQLIVDDVNNSGSGDLSDSGTILLAGTVFVGTSLIVDPSGVVDVIGTGIIDVNGTLTVEGTIALDGGVIDLATRYSNPSQPGTLVGGGGTISNGAIIIGDGSLDFSSPLTLSGDTIIGPLLLDTNNPGGSTVEVVNRLTIESATQGAGTIGLTGASASLVLKDSEAFNNLTIDLGTTSQIGLASTIDIAAGNTLTLGNQSTLLTAAGQNANIDGSLVNNGMIFDDGSMSINGSGGGGVVTASIAASPSTTFDNAFAFYLDGTLSVDTASVRFINSGFISGAGTLIGTIENQGSITAQGGELVVTNAVSGTGDLVMYGGGTLDLLLGSPESILFDGSDTTLILGAPKATTGTFYNLSEGDSILLNGETIASANLGYNALTLDLAGGGTLHYAVGPWYGSLQAEVIDNGAGVEIACFRRATRIATPQGERPVELLAVGDTVITGSGEKRVVRWLGHQTLDLRHHPHPHTARPVRIAAGAIAPMLPRADLWVSPEHAVLIDDLLIPAIRLVNDATIAQVPVETVEYWHLELDAHDLVRAEGLAAESYLDTGTRESFIEGPAWLARHPGATPFHWTQTCRPLVLDGDRLVAVRQALQARAEALGYRWTDAHDLHVMADGRRIDGLAIVEGQWRFAIPCRTALLRLVSRVWTPARAIPGSADIRRLGVCVGRLQIDGADRDLAALDGAAGWHEVESDGSARWRWTTGVAALPAGARSVVVDVVGPGRYVAEPARPPAMDAAAA